jgi:hypothetical protein
MPTASASRSSGPRSSGTWCPPTPIPPPTRSSWRCGPRSRSSRWPPSTRASRRWSGAGSPSSSRTATGPRATTVGPTRTTTPAASGAPGSWTSPGGCRRGDRGAEPRSPTASRSPGTASSSPGTARMPRSPAEKARPDPGHGTPPRAPPPPPARGSAGPGSGGGSPGPCARVSGPFRGVPTAYAAPADAEDLSLSSLHAAEGLGIPLVPRGAGTGMPGGNLGPESWSPSAEGFRGMDAPRPDGTVRAGAGVVAGRLEAGDGTLRGSPSPLFPPPARPDGPRWAGWRRATAAGARSFGHGAMAVSWALEGVDADGSPVRTGPGGDPGTLPASPLDPELGLPRSGCPGGWPRRAAEEQLRVRDRPLAADREPGAAPGGERGDPPRRVRGRPSAGSLPPARGVLLVAVFGMPPRPGDLALAAEELGASACEFLGRRLLEMAASTGSRGRAPGPGRLRPLPPRVRGVTARGGRHWPGASHGDGGGVPGLATAEAEVSRRLWGLRHRASPTHRRQGRSGRISTQFIEDSVVPPRRLGRLPGRAGPHPPREPAGEWTPWSSATPATGTFT